MLRLYFDMIFSVSLRVTWSCNFFLWWFLTWESRSQGVPRHKMIKGRNKIAASTDWTSEADANFYIWEFSKNSLFLVTQNGRFEVFWRIPSFSFSFYYDWNTKGGHLKAETCALFKRDPVTNIFWNLCTLTIQIQTQMIKKITL